MGKSSSSRKKRRSGASSPAQKKSKSRRRTKSKKLRQRYDSGSSSSDYDSPSMSSASLSSSGDEYRRRKRSRSPARNSTKKKSRRYSYSSESGEDLPPQKKRKGSRKDDDLGVRKKTSKKKRRSRNRRSVSSSSRDFSSCSTCQGSEESEFERCGTWDRHERKLGDDNIRHKSSKLSLEGADEIEERLAVGNIPMRLKSVITIANDRDERNLDQEEPKEEIIYDHDEYPSCRSNGSNDGGSKKELASDSKVESKIGQGTYEEADTSCVRSPGFEAESAGNGEPRDKINPCSDVSFVAVHNMKVADASGSGDLELILRQRALENLKRFKGGRRKGKEVSSDTRENNGDSKQSAAPSIESSQNSLPKKDDSAKAADATLEKPKQTNAEGSIAHSVRRNSSNIAVVEDKNGGKEGGSTKPPAIKGVRQITGPGSFNQRVSSPSAGGFTVNSARVNPFTWKRDSPITKPVSKESHHPQATPVANETVHKSFAKLAESGLSANKASNDIVANQPLGSASKNLSLGGKTAPVKMKSVKDVARDGTRRIMAPKESHPQAKQVENEVVNEGCVKLAEAEPSGIKASNDVGANQPCGSASKDPSSNRVRETKSVKDEAKDGTRRTMAPKESHPRAKQVTNGAVNRGSAKLTEAEPSANKASDDVGANQPCGSASKDPSSNRAVEMKSVKIEARDVPRRTMAPKDSHPRVKQIAIEAVNKGSVKLAEAEPSAYKAGNDVGANQSKDPSSSGVEETARGEMKSVKDEAKDGPQYEEKTMSVMRGGEIVQVKYQVYIPKRAPALARRQLKR